MDWIDNYNLYKYLNSNPGRPVLTWNILFVLNNSLLFQRFMFSILLLGTEPTSISKEPTSMDKEPTTMSTTSPVKDQEITEKRNALNENNEKPS